MNTLSDLNEVLFESIKKLSDEELSPEELDKEIKRSDSISKLSKNIIENAELVLKARIHIDEVGGGETLSLPMFGEKNA